MNVCGFSRVNYWQGIKGGMELHGKFLSEGLVSKGHQVTLLSTKHPHSKKFEEKNGVKIINLINTVFGSRRKGWSKESVKKFLELHENIPFDVIWSQSYDAYGLTLLKKNSLRIPVITILHGCAEQEIKTFIVNFFIRLRKPNKIIKSMLGLIFFYSFIQRKFLNFSDKIITVSQEVSESIRKIYGTKIAEKCFTVVNGVDTSIFKNETDQRIALRKKYKISKNDILLLTIGRITHEKGYHLAINALLHLKNQKINTKLMIVGKGEYLDQLKKEVKRKQLEKDVIFCGFIENDETVAYYNCADVILNPTLTSEGLSYVLLEAMACGKPVVASKIGGVNSIIKNCENGLLFDAGNSSQMAANIKLIINNPLLAEKISFSARKTILQNFSIETTIKNTLSIISKSAQKTLKK